MTHTHYLRRFDRVRLRVDFDLERGKVARFVVQLEFLANENWVPVVRYDTAHGFAHCDRYRPDGSVSQHEPTSQQDYNKALTSAIEHVRDNWQQLARPFEEALP